VKHGVSVQAQLAEGLPRIQADRVQIQQVILNLIMNAVEGMSGAREASRELLVGTERDAAGGVVVTVQDSGPGLNLESFDRVFEAFYTTKPRGMGMGLSICRSIRRSSRGTDMGLAQGRAGRDLPVHSANGCRGSGITEGEPVVFVVDDDHALCELVISMLSRTGFKVVAAFDGPTGIETARDAYPAVILLDMMMPGLNGIGTCERLKQNPVLADIPVVGMTAFGDLKYAEKVFRAGAEFFLPKPFRAESPLRVVRPARETAERQSRAPRLERRVRLATEILVRCLIREGSHPAREIVGRTGNISLTGLLLLPEVLARGSAIHLQLQFPEASLSAEARVIGHDPQLVSGNRFRHGVHLTRFGHDIDLVQYRRFLNHLAVGNATVMVTNTACVCGREGRFGGTGNLIRSHQGLTPP
jgi:CheY-like chemotaxis protein